MSRGNIYIFSIPTYSSNRKFYPNICNDLIVKRCVGIPGDKILINENQLFINNTLWKTYFPNPFKLDKSKMLDINNPIYGINLKSFYPHDSIYEWNASNYGSLYIPKKNVKIQLTDSLRILYEDMIFYEMKDSSSSKMNVINEYIFNKDYYLFIGDNFYGSIDSRHWGVIPKNNIIAEVKYIVWSKSKKHFFRRIKKC